MFKDSCYKGIIKKIKALVSHDYQLDTNAVKVMTMADGIVAVHFTMHCVCCARKKTLTQLVTITEIELIPLLQLAIAKANA